MVVAQCWLIPLTFFFECLHKHRWILSKSLFLFLGKKIDNIPELLSKKLLTD